MMRSKSSLPPNSTTMRPLCLPIDTDTFVSRLSTKDQSYLYDDNAYSILEEERARFKQIEPELRAHRIRIRKKMRFNEYGLFLNTTGARYYAKLRRLAIESGVFDLDTDEGKVCGLIEDRKSVV